VKQKAQDSRDELHELAFKRILAPVDFSGCSRKALRYAVAFARQFQAEVILLHIAETAPLPPHQMVMEGGDLETELRKQEAEQLEDWRKEEAKQVTSRAVTRLGLSPDEEIVRMAKGSEVDLIVMGTHGRSGMAHLLIGSTAERVVRHAPCPVMVVPEKAGEIS
jgi:universal stress protein A